MRRWTESAIACVLLLIGGVYAYGILLIPDRELADNEIGPTVFPWLLAVLLTVLAASLLAGQWLRPAQDQDAAANGDNATTARTAGAASLILLYVLALPMLGFLWSTPCFIVPLSMLHDRRRLPVVAAVAIGVAVGLHFGTRHFFGAMAP